MADALAGCKSVLIGHGDDLIIDLGVQHIGDKACADALNLVGTCMAFAEDGRILRLHGNDLHTGLLALEILAHAGQGAAGTDAGKAGFITALYVVLVPVFGLFFKRKVNLSTWIAVVCSVVALYLLCIKGDFSLAPGDLLVLVCAVCFAIHILVIDHFTATVDGLKLSCVQFFVAAVWATIAKVVCVILGMNGTGDVSAATSIFAAPDWNAILACALPILYVGIFSSGVGYTLQILAQKDSNPTVVTILLSLESVFAVIAGAIILKQQMSVREYIGCAVMFIAVILAQIQFPVKKKAE